MPSTEPFLQIQTQVDPLNPGLQGESRDFTQVLTILEKRLPKSCFIYNAVKISPRFPQHSKIFWVNLKSCGVDLDHADHHRIGEESWIIVTHFTEDHGQNILISAPSPLRNDEKEGFLQIFASCPKTVLNWEEPYWFIALDVEIARLITEISVEMKGHNVLVDPDTLMYLDKDEEGLIARMDQDLTEFSRTYPNLEIARLDPVHGTQFITSTWKLAAPETCHPVKRLLTANESGGVYSREEESQILSGLLLNGLGLLSMLHTTESARGMGFAGMGITLVSRDLLNHGLFPVSSIQVWNTASIRIHSRLGFRVGGPLRWIMWRGNKEGKLLLENKAKSRLEP